MSSAAKVKAVLPSSIDDAIVEYIAQILDSGPLSAEDIAESVVPLLLDTGAVQQSEVDAVVGRLVRAVRGDEATVEAAKAEAPRLLSAPVMMLEKMKSFESSLADRLRVELNLKSDLFTNKLIETWGSGEILDEAAMKARAKNEKKTEKQERKGITREKSAANERNELLEQLTRAPVVLHEKGEFGSIVAGGAVDIHLNNVTMDVGGLIMLDDCTVTISYGRRFGLVGRNGVGKTTFLKHIAAKAFPGIPAHLQVLHIEQEVQGTAVSVLQTVLNTDIEREALLGEERSINATDAERQASGLDADETSSARLSEIYRRLDEIQAHDAVARASTILSGLGFTSSMQARPTSEFSGGWRMRVSLAVALFIAPDILLLDEPTNHLDLHAVLWLEEYLQGWKKTLIVVSHARDFLNNVVTDILHLQNKQLTRFKGNYDNFEERRAESAKLSEKHIEAQTARRAHIQQFVDRFRASAARASLVQSRIKALQKMETLSAAFIDPEIQFKFPDPEPVTGQAQIQLVDVGFGYKGYETLFSKVDLTVKPDSRMGLVGPNGAGKSTLLKLLLGELEPTSGVMTSSGKLRVERFTQHHVDQLNMKKSPLEAFKLDHPTDPPQRIRAHLGSMGITGKLALQPIGTLSGGQKSRVALAKITYTNPHILFLDEPTNHLDLDTVQALIEGLVNFQGALFIISHDEHLITAVCNELLVLEDHKLVNFDGDFEDYKKSLKKKQAGKA